MAPEEPQTIALAPANMTMCELRADIVQHFDIPPAQLWLVIQDRAHREGEGNPGLGAEGSGSGDGALVGDGSDPPATVWGSGVRTGMRILVCAVAPRVPPRPPPRPSQALASDPPGATETYTNVLLGGEWTNEEQFSTGIGDMIAPPPSSRPSHPASTLESEWDEQFDPGSGRQYYINRSTSESAWNIPEPAGGGGPPPSEAEMWSVDRIVQLRHEALESEVSRVRKKADYVGVVGFCVYIVGTVVGACVFDFHGYHGSGSSSASLAMLLSSGSVP
jgi:hypothetical protein